MFLLRMLPLLLFVVVAYNVLAFGGVSVVPGFESMERFLLSEAGRISLVAGPWSILWQDVFLAAALIALFFEIVRSTGFGKSAIFNHMFSMGVFVVSLMEFLLAKGFTTSTFFLITLMTLIDVVGGFTVSIITARRDIGIAGGAGVLDQM
jgi:hypothetical protein